MSANQTHKNRSECQKAYRKSLKETQALCRKIERALIDMPAAAEGNGSWALVGTVNHLKSQMQEISDMLYNEGEYA